jgi:hypothetical protein
MDLSRELVNTAASWDCSPSVSVFLVVVQRSAKDLSRELLYTAACWDSENFTQHNNPLQNQVNLPSDTVGILAEFLRSPLNIRSRYCACLKVIEASAAPL